MVVLWRTEREMENTPTGDVVFSLSETYRAMWSPTSWVGSTHPALSQHASFCPTSPLSPAGLCIVIVLFSLVCEFRCLRSPPAVSLFSALYVSSPRSLTSFLSGRVLSAFLSLFTPLPISPS